MSEDNKWPRWRFHKSTCPDGKIVKTAEDNEKLGEGWVDSPSQFEQAPVLTDSEELQSAPEVEPQQHAEPETESQEPKEEFTEKELRQFLVEDFGFTKKEVSKLSYDELKELFEAQKVD